MANEESGSGRKFIVGLIIGVAISYAYVRFGYQPPAIVQLADRVTSEAVIVAAETSLYSPTSQDDERQRAMAVILSQQPDLLIDVNEQLSDTVLIELLRRKALRRAMLLKQQVTAYGVALSKPALRQRLVDKYGDAEDEVLKQRILAAAIRDDDFLLWYLNRYALGGSDQHLINIVMRAYQNELRVDRLAAIVNDGQRIRQ